MSKRSGAAASGPGAKQPRLSSIFVGLRLLDDGLCETRNLAKVVAQHGGVLLLSPPGEKEEPATHGALRQLLAALASSCLTPPFSPSLPQWW